MNQTDAPKSISFDEALRDPAYAHARDVIKYVATATSEQLAPRKFKMAHKDAISDTLKKLHKKSPDAPLRKVIYIALKYVPDDTSTKTVLELTEWAASEWEKLRQPVGKPNARQLKLAS